MSYMLITIKTTTSTSIQFTTCFIVLTLKLTKSNGFHPSRVYRMSNSSSWKEQIL